MASSNQPYPYSGSGTRHSPPSPSSSSPGLTQSTSNSSCSPPQPSTPPRRQNTRQSDQGRIPLHRRGTSRTYENLEDLLREAGYKETRIYTPESDRIESHAHDEEGGQSAGKVRGMRAAVVGFLTGLVTGTGNDTAPSNLRQDQATSSAQRPRLLRTQSPSSPLQEASSYRRENAQSVEYLETRTPMTSSIESLGDPTPRADCRQTLGHRQNHTSSQPSTPYCFEERSSSPAPRCPAYSDHHTQDWSLLPHHVHQHHHPRNSVAPAQIQKHPSWSSITTPSNNNVTSLDPSSNDTNASSSNNSTIVINHPAPSRAGTYLRHVMSTPPIAPPKSPYRNQDNSSTEGTQALSRKWLDSVARVLMFGAGTTPLGYTISPTAPNAPTPSILQSPSALAFPSPIQRPSSFNHHLHLQHQQHHNQQQHQHHNPHHRALRPSRSSISQATYRSALSASTTMTTRPRLELRDQTNISPLPPPVFLTRFGRERAPCSQSQVSKTRVYCRSAPASRASSPGRSTFHSHNKNENNNNKKHDLKDISNNSGGGKVGKGSGKRGHNYTHRSRGRVGRRKKGDGEDMRVPSLAKTRVEGDAWHKGGGKGRRSWVSENNNNDPFSSSDNHHHHHRHHHHHHHHHHLSPRHNPNNNAEDGGEFYEDEGDDESYDEDTEDDEEGELDLARMLVNPKRQQSIRSLRKHLHHSKQLLTSPTTFTDSSKIGESSSSNAVYPDNSITNPSLSRLHVSNHHLTSSNTHQRRFVSGRQTRQGDDDSAGQWERQWRSGELSSSRRGSEDDDVYESLTWLNDDKGTDSKRKNNGSRPWNSSNAFQGPR